MLTLNLAGVPSGVYDVFAYLNNGTVYFDLGPAWSNATTRSMALGMFLGSPVNSVAMTTVVNKHSVAAQAGLLLGAIYLESPGTVIFSRNAKNVSNLYNQRPAIVVFDGFYGIRAYGSQTYREWNGGVGNARGRFVLPFGSEILFQFAAQMYQGGRAGISVNATNIADGTLANDLAGWSASSYFRGQLVSAGYNFFTMVESGWLPATAQFVSANACAALII